MSNTINGETHCLNCGNEYMESWEYRFNMCEDCLSDATSEYMSKTEHYKVWRELE